MRAVAVGSGLNETATVRAVAGGAAPKGAVAFSQGHTLFGTATIAGGGTVDFVRYTGRPLSNFNRVIAFESTARSKYNGITLDMQRRFAGNWQARLAWTHSTVKDNKPDATAVVPFSSGDDAKYASDPLNLDRDYTFGVADVRDRVVLSGVWTLDSYSRGMQSSALRALAGG